jgi:hypothetical protein
MWYRSTLHAQFEKEGFRVGRRTGLFNEIPVLYCLYVRLLNQFGIMTSTSSMLPTAHVFLLPAQADFYIRLSGLTFLVAGRLQNQVP